ncbi:uncharacterized protein LOC5510836 isoform X3 [Nematostella vectensis]|uniref:uncharacterized protein LOC5510836 isoform X3 n=1 Tax=Nematostella vectensis TaxID=45351 RepID=UPI0020777651|nr:uncharacterized protein LOC5510836 isoform X3 [Nematostella vectensis]
MNRRKKKIDAFVKRDPKDRKKIVPSTNENTLPGSEGSNLLGTDGAADLRDKIPKLSRTILQDPDKDVNLESTGSLSLVDPSYGETVGVETFDYSHGRKGEKVTDGSLDLELEIEEARTKLFSKLESEQSDLRALIKQQREEEAHSKKGPSAMGFRDTLLAYGNEDKKQTDSDFSYSKGKKEGKDKRGSTDDSRSSRSKGDSQNRGKRREKSPGSPSGFDLGRPFFSSGKEGPMSDSSDLRAALKELAYLRSIQTGGEYSLPREEEEYFRKINDLSKTSILDDPLDDSDRSVRKRKLEIDFRAAPSRSPKSKKDPADLGESESKWEEVIDKFIVDSPKEKDPKKKHKDANSPYGPALPPFSGTLYSDLEIARQKSEDRLVSKKDSRRLKDSSPPPLTSSQENKFRGRGRGFRGGRGDRGTLRGALRGTFRGRGRGRGFQAIRGARGRGFNDPTRGRHIFKPGSLRRSRSRTSLSSRSRSRDRGGSRRGKRRSRSRSSSYSSRSRSRSRSRDRGRGRKRSRRRSRSSSHSSSSLSRSRSRSRSRGRGRRRSRSRSSSRKGKRQRSRSWSYDEDYSKSSKGKATAAKKDKKLSIDAKSKDVRSKSKSKSVEKRTSTEKSSKEPDPGVSKMMGPPSQTQLPNKAASGDTEKILRRSRSKEKDIKTNPTVQEAKVSAVTGVFVPRTITRTVQGMKIPAGRGLKAPAHPVFRVPVDEEDEEEVPLRKEPAKPKKAEPNKDDIAQNHKFKAVFESEVDRVFGRKEAKKEAAPGSAPEQAAAAADKPKEEVNKQKKESDKQEESKENEGKEMTRKEKRKKIKEERNRRKKERKREKRKKKAEMDIFSSDEEGKKANDDQFDDQSLEGGSHVDQGDVEALQEGVAAVGYEDYYQEGGEYYNEEQGWYDEAGQFHPYQEGEVYYYDEQGNIVEGYDAGQVYGQDGQLLAPAVEATEAYGEEYYTYEGADQQAYPSEQVYVEGQGEAQYADDEWDYVEDVVPEAETYGYETYQGVEGQEYLEAEQYVTDATTWEGYTEAYVETEEQQWIAPEASYAEGGEEYVDYQYDASQAGGLEDYYGQHPGVVGQESHWDQHQGGEETYARPQESFERPQVIDYGHSGFAQPLPIQDDLSASQGSQQRAPVREKPARPLKSILKKKSSDAESTSVGNTATAAVAATTAKPRIGENVGPEYIVRLADSGNRQFYCKLCNCYIASVITKELHAKSIKHVEFFVREKSSLLQSVLGVPTLNAIEKNQEKEVAAEVPKQLEEQPARNLPQTHQQVHGRLGEYDGRERPYVDDSRQVEHQSSPERSQATERSGRLDHDRLEAYNKQDQHNHDRYDIRTGRMPEEKHFTRDDNRRNEDRIQPGRPRPRLEPADRGRSQRSDRRSLESERKPLRDSERRAPDSGYEQSRNDVPSGNFDKRESQYTRSLLRNTFSGLHDSQTQQGDHQRRLSAEKQNQPPYQRPGDRSRDSGEQRSSSDNRNSNDDVKAGKSQTRENPQERGNKESTVESKDVKNLRENEARRSSSPKDKRSSTPDSRKPTGENKSHRNDRRPPTPQDKKQEPPSRPDPQQVGRGHPSTREPQRTAPTPRTQQPPARGRGLPAGRGAPRGRGVPPPPPRGGGQGYPAQGGRGAYQQQPAEGRHVSDLSQKPNRSLNPPQRPSREAPPAQPPTYRNPAQAPFEATPREHLPKAPQASGQGAFPIGAIPRGAVPRGAVPIRSTGDGSLRQPALSRFSSVAVRSQPARPQPPAPPMHAGSIPAQSIPVAPSRGTRQYPPRGAPMMHRGRGHPPPQYTGGVPAHRAPPAPTRGGPPYRGSGASYRGRGRAW